MTIAFSVPAGVIIFKQPKKRNFRLGLVILSLGFLFFSYHVHEKTILLPLLPLLVNYKELRFLVVDFGAMALFTNYFMLVEDGLELQYWVVLLGYCFFGSKINTEIGRRLGTQSQFDVP